MKTDKEVEIIYIFLQGVYGPLESSLSSPLRLLHALSY